MANIGIRVYLERDSAVAQIEHANAWRGDVGKYNIVVVRRSDPGTSLFQPVECDQVQVPIRRRQVCQSLGAPLDDLCLICRQVGLRLIAGACASDAEETE